jgi:hypothetical protein
MTKARETDPLFDEVHDWVVRHVGQRPLELGEAEFARRIRLGITRGRRLGLRWRSSLIAYVGLTFQVGPGFDEHPAIKEALGHGSPDRAMMSLPDRIAPEAWHEAQQLASARGWAALERTALH